MNDVRPQIVFKDDVKEKIEAVGISVLETGEIVFRGSKASPWQANSDVELAKTEVVTIDKKEGDEQTFVAAYLLWPMEYFFEFTVAKNETGEDMLYFYPPQEEEMQSSM